MAETTTAPAWRETDEPRRDRRARAFCELTSLVRGLLARFGGEDVAEIRAARRWVHGHCPGCGVAKPENRDACDDCRRTWRETIGRSRAAKQPQDTA
jgi:hypothetical protein